MNIKPGDRVRMDSGNEYLVEEINEETHTFTGIRTKVGEENRWAKLRQRVSRLCTESVAAVLPPEVTLGQVWKADSTGGLFTLVRKLDDNFWEGTGPNGRRASLWEEKGTLPYMTLVSDVPEEVIEMPYRSHDYATYNLKPGDTIAWREMCAACRELVPCKCPRPLTEAEIAAKMEAHNAAFHKEREKAVAAAAAPNWEPRMGGNPLVRRYNQRGGR